MSQEAKTDQLIASARDAYLSGDYDQAIRLFEQARQHFLDEGNSVKAAEMANNLSTVYVKSKQKKKALEIILGTDEIFRSAGQPLNQAIALGNLGAAYDELKDFENAERAYKQSAELFEQEGDVEKHSIVMKSLSTLYIRQGKQLEGIFSMQKSLSSEKKLTFREKVLQQILKLPFKFLGK
jgi:tetratricopeptide (TPR) repeat protein